MIAEDVRRGLTQSPKSLPAYLFYDDQGSLLYERITELPEYYLTRAERSILAAQADAIIAAALGSSPRAATVVELGAGSATKTELLLRALLRRQARGVYVAIDVSASALENAVSRLAANLPGIITRPVLGPHARALRSLRRLEPPVIALFIGSSIGNFEDDEATALLRSARTSLGRESALVLGVDLRKDPAVLVRAYDDAAGVTAAFNLNVLARINRELGGHFDLGRFRHVALWNNAASRIEMHLESLVAHEVAIDALGVTVRFVAGETIHTESSIKYTPERVERLLRAGGFASAAAFADDERRFTVYVAHAV